MVCTRRRYFLVAMCATLMLAVALAWHLYHPPALYRVTILPSLGGQFTLPCAINEHGQIAGFSEVGRGNYHLFLWDRAGGMQDLGPVYNNLVDINNAGQIVGTVIDPNGIRQAFLWDSIGGVRLLGTQGGISSQARAINNLGQVVGTFETSPGIGHAFLWDEVHGMRDLGPGHAWAINDAGQVIVLAKGGPVIVDTSADVITAGRQVPARGLRGINSNGWIAGSVRPSATKPGKTDVVVWHAGSGTRTLMQVDGDGHSGAINDANQVLIMDVRPAVKVLGRTVAPYRDKPCLHDPQRGLVPLDRYVPTGWRENFWPTDLNNRGCIVGAVQSEDGPRSTGVLLEPIPKRWKERKAIAGRQP